LSDPKFKPFFSENFVTVKLHVKETPENKNLENPGGDELLQSLHGDKAGLPFLAVLDAQGKMIVNSNRLEDGKAQQSNIGHPVKPEEVDHFMAMMRKTAPRAKPEQLAALEAHLRSQKLGQ
jgi:hypothetical protein